LDELKTSKHFTVEAFQEKEYIDVAGYLSFPIILQAAINEDRQTKQKLEDIISNDEASDDEEELVEGIENVEKKSE